MSLSQPSHTITAEPVQKATTAPVPTHAPADEKPKPVKVPAQA